MHLVEISGRRKTYSLLLSPKFTVFKRDYYYYLVKTIVQCQGVVSEQLLLLETEQPFAEC